MSFKAAAEAFFKQPTSKTWDELAHKIVPGTMRTVWQGWIRVDGNAPVELRTTAAGKHKWDHIPDPFTARRAIREVRSGKVPAGWWWLKEKRPAPVPGQRVIRPATQKLDDATIADAMLSDLTQSKGPLGRLKSALNAHSVHIGKREVEFRWRKRARLRVAGTVAANRAVISLNERNFYTVEFSFVGRGKKTEFVSRYDDVHANILKSVFEHETGLSL
jgi:hypothetical protein